MAQKNVKLLHSSLLQFYSIDPIQDCHLPYHSNVETILPLKKSVQTSLISEFIHLQWQETASLWISS